MKKLHMLAAAVLVLLCARTLPAGQDVRKLTIDEMFRLASENSKKIKLSNASVNIANRAVDAAKKSRLPSIGVSLSAAYLGDAIITNRDFSSSLTAPMPHFQNSFAFEATQILFAGGAISNSIEKAELEEQIAQLNFKKDQMDIRFLLVSWYLDLYKMQNQREVYLKNIEQINLLISQIKAKHQEGMALINDITRHELMLENIKLALIEIDNNCTIINNHLTKTLGLPQSTLIKPDSSVLNAVQGSAMDIEEYLQTAQENMTEIKSASVSSFIAEKGVEIAKAGYLPSLALVAAYHMDGPITVEIPPINKNLNYWYAGVGLKYNLSSLFTTKKDVSLATATLDAVNNARELIAEESMLAVRSTYIKYSESFDRLQSAEKSLSLANENYDVINNRYMSSLVLITEMLDASNSKLDAELQVVNARINIVFNYYKLKHISGIL